MSGANVRRSRGASRCKLAWPAVLASLLILFVRAIESFEVPALLGLPVGIEVFTSAIYQAIHRYPSQVGLASAYAVTLLVIASLGVYFAVAAVAAERIAIRDGDRQGLPSACDGSRRLALLHGRDRSSSTSC